MGFVQGIMTILLKGNYQRRPSVNEFGMAWRIAEPDTSKDMRKAASVVEVVLSGVLPASADVNEAVEDEDGSGASKTSMYWIDSTPALNQISRLYSITENLYSSHDSSASQLPAPR